MTQSTIVRRSSFLKRNPALTPAKFSAYYETSHGPLAAGLTGFRKHTLRYVQNHVEALNGVEPLFDGITMTTQVPREDYSHGFFNEPDYEKVKDDELYLFDMSQTVSVLADVLYGPVTPREGVKAVFLAGRDWQAPDALELDGALAHSLTRINPASATALGFRGAAFDHPYMIETWFKTPSARGSAVERVETLFGNGAAAMPVREVLIFGPEKPWPSEAGR